jgi:serine/threonine-protein kinase
MAEIFLARARTELGVARLVVVKQILPQLSGNEMFADMLIAEAKLAARLSHANVVQVFDLGRHEDVLFIAMEYVEGFDLNDLLRRCARSRIPLPVDFALLIVMEALRGLGYAHRCAGDSGAPIGIVHRDVSPSNVLISFEGEVKLCDFGIARANDMADLLSDEVIKGKAGYMSPEQARGESLDARADLFAAGIVLWELLAGRKLYKTRPTGPSLLDLAREASIPALPTRGLPNEDELHAIVSRALAKNRNDRYPAAQAMLRDLETYVGRSRLIASPIRFGEWLRDHFGENIIASRRARERAAKAIERDRVVGGATPSARPGTNERLGERERADARNSVAPDAPAVRSPRCPPPSSAFSKAETHPTLLHYAALGLLIGVAVLVAVWFFSSR